jgi:CheY-like chemotaxis protein
VQPTFDARGQILTVDIPSDTCLLLGDAIRLEQLVCNVLNNASKYTPREGRIWLSLEITAGDDHVGEAVVRVRDDGVGIMTNLQPGVFDLFQQAGHSPHQVPGLGVGLAIVQRIATLHGGRVSVQSDGVNRGSQFIVTLPLLQQGIRASAGTPERPIPSEEGPLRILVIDDNIDAAETLGEYLRMRGHDVRIEHSGAAALDTAATFLPDIAFVDIAMPVMDGYEVARLIRALPGLEQVRLVALTGFGRDEDRRKAAAAGFADHVTKPLHPAAVPLLLARSRPREGIDPGQG